MRGLRLVHEADQQKGLTVAQDRLDGDGKPAAIALGTAGAGHDHTCVILGRFMDRRAEFRPLALRRHCQQIAGRWAGRHPQILVDRAQGIEALMVAVDQHRRRGIGFEYQPAA